MLNRLSHIGYFDQTTDLSNVEGLNTYKSVLISSALTSIAMSTVLTPLDMIVFNQLQTRLYSVQQSAGLKNISFRQVAGDLWRTQGLGKIATMTFASSLIRNFFTLTIMYCVDNYQRNMAMSSQSEAIQI